MKNIEVKYRLINSREIYDYLNALPEVEFVWLHEQTDIYYNSPNGRLKLRSESSNPAQLVYYQRPDSIEIRESYYEIYLSENPSNLKSILQKALDIKITVTKKRTLFMFRNVRIHLDKVEGLGDFMEMESVVDEKTSYRTAEDNLKEIQNKLMQFQLEPVARSYSDLLAEQKNRKSKKTE